MMDSYDIPITLVCSEEVLLTKTFIFIYRASRIPPHIGIITGGKVYDITSVGPNLGLNVNDFYKTAKKRKTETLFVELNSNVESEELTPLIAEKVRKYWKVSNGVTCLSPVKEFITEGYGVDVSDAKFIFELLPKLYSIDLVKGVSQLNLNEKIKDGIFSLITYTEKDVEDCIRALERKEKVTC
jgi:fumarylacetoacetate (FAA) hydrolase family protein